MAGFDSTIDNERNGVASVCADVLQATGETIELVNGGC